MDVEHALETRARKNAAMSVSRDTRGHGSGEARPLRSGPRRAAPRRGGRWRRIRQLTMMDALRIRRPVPCVWPTPPPVSWALDLSVVSKFRPEGFRRVYPAISLPFLLRRAKRPLKRVNGCRIHR